VEGHDYSEDGNKLAQVLSEPLRIDVKAPIGQSLDEVLGDEPFEEPRHVFQLNVFVEHFDRKLVQWRDEKEES